MSTSGQQTFGPLFEILNTPLDDNMGGEVEVGAFSVEVKGSMLTPQVGHQPERLRNQRHPIGQFLTVSEETVPKI